MAKQTIPERVAQAIKRPDRSKQPDGFYTGRLIVMNGQVGTITDYDGATSTMTVDWGTMKEEKVLRAEDVGFIV